MKNKKELYTLVRPVRGRVLLLSVLTLCNAVLQVALALLMRYVIDAAVYQNGKLAFWGGMLVADLGALVALNCWINWLSGSTTDRFAAALRCKLVEAAAYSNDVRLQGFHSGQLLSRGMEDVYTVCDSVVNALPTLVGQVARLITAFGAVLLIYPSIAGILLIAAVVTVTAVAIMRPVLKARHRSVRAADEQVMATMQEDLQQLELVQSLGVEHEILNRFDKILFDTTKDAPPKSKTE